MELDELAKLIKTRSSIRHWQDKDVPEELLIKAIELATWAPNGGNQQNWRFYLIENRNTIRAIADAVQAAADKIVSWPEANQFGDTTKGLRERASFFRTAPAAIAVAAAQYQSPVDKILAAREIIDPAAREMRQWRLTSNTRIQSIASAVAYLLLILHQMGLGAVWMVGPTQSKGAIEKILKVPPELDFVAFIPVGYPDEAPVSRKRRPVMEVCEVIK
ncbi:MAG: nitroreductase [Dehalococcoidales bacterium]|nr:nitroreductase [Dehalococcoidales bacterium]